MEQGAAGAGPARCGWAMRKRLAAGGGSCGSTGLKGSIIQVG